MEQHKKGVCEICLMPISHPICINCYSKHVRYWLKDLNISQLKKLELDRKLRRMLLTETLNEERCIVCGKEAVSVCSYCFFLKMSRLLVALDFSKKSQDSFQEIFNYQIDADFEDYKELTQSNELLVAEE